MGRQATRKLEPPRQVEAAPAERGLEAKVGSALRALRHLEELTLDELSQRSGVSTAMISRIERGQVSASLSTLDALARAIGVPVANFFGATTEQSEISFVKAGSGVDVQRFGSTYGHAYKLVGKISLPHLTFEPYLITIDSSSIGQPLFQHTGAEYIFILKGRMRYRCGGRTFDLEEGDSLSFDAGIPHGPEELLSRSVTFLTVVAAHKAGDSAG